MTLLEKYFFDDWNKIRLVLTDHRKEDTSLQFIDEAEENKDLFRHDVVAVSEEWTLNEDTFYQPEAYMQIIDAKRACPKDFYILQEETITPWIVPVRSSLTTPNNIIRTCFR